MRHMQQEMEITVSVQKLIDSLRANKEKHIVEYEEAKASYLEKVGEFLESCEDNIDNDVMRKDNYQHRLHQPLSMVHEYDKWIQMFEDAEEESIKISKSQYDCFVNDEWEWLNQAKTINQFYVSSA